MLEKKGGHVTHLQALRKREQRVPICVVLAPGQCTGEAVELVHRGVREAGSYVVARKLKADCLRALLIQHETIFKELQLLKKAKKNEEMLTVVKCHEPCTVGA